MKVFAALFLLATFAIITNAQVPIPPVYAGPLASNQFAPVPGANVRLAQSNFVLQWGKAVLTANRAARIGLFNLTRLMALVHVAMHDTLQGYEQEYETYVTGLPLPSNKANVQAAISGAAYTIFRSYFANDFVENSKYDSLLAFQQDVLSGKGISASRIANGFLYGQTVANALLAARANDGFNIIPTFVPQSGPGFWRPTAPDFPIPAGQGWGAVTPWRLSQPIANYFPLDGNTYFTNASRYIIDYLEVLGRGRALTNRAVTTLQRTGAETFIATFWSNDFRGTSLPPGQYLETAQIIGASAGLSLSNYTRLLALASLSIANINIVAWAVKYTVQEWRPITAIQEAATDTYSETVADPSWTPLSVTTPPFPDYISGHASFGYGLAQVFRSVFGTDNYEFAIPSDSLPTVTANYRHFSDMATDNSLSRVYLGVHFRAAVLDGQQTGDSIALDMYNNVLRPL